MNWACVSNTEMKVVELMSVKSSFIKQMMMYTYVRDLYSNELTIFRLILHYMSKEAKLRNVALLVKNCLLHSTS